MIHLKKMNERIDDLKKEGHSNEEICKIIFGLFFETGCKHEIVKDGICTFCRKRLII